MKISPMSSGSGQPGAALNGVNVGRTASPEKMERARAIAKGEQPPEVSPSAIEQPRPNVNKIRMRVNRTTNRDEPPMDEAALADVSATESPTDAAPVVEQSSTPDAGEAPVVEVTQPLSPQLAALAQHKRALQVKERELAEREKALESKATTEGVDGFIARLKSQPLSVLQEHGVTYEQLTDAILNGQSGANAEIAALKAEIESLKKGVDQKLSDRDTQAEQAALAEMRREADRLARDGEAFELVRETRSVPKVVDLIHRTFKETGEILGVEEAMQMIEGELEKDALRLAALKKVQGRLAPQAPATSTEPQLQSQQQPKQMRTLTARDTSTAPLTARQRAIAAFRGQPIKR